mmetsp:Transcript_11435/g.40639  ORF Transcript_11435/g.40639 Transcript_11435/m.40639 type:complete len:220 (+) Transcript_11435:632-1291(+)
MPAVSGSSARGCRRPPRHGTWRRFRRRRLEVRKAMLCLRSSRCSVRGGAILWSACVPRRRRATTARAASGGSAAPREGRCAARARAGSAAPRRGRQRPGTSATAATPRTPLLPSPRRRAPLLPSPRRPAEHPGPRRLLAALPPRCFAIAAHAAASRTWSPEKSAATMGCHCRCCRSMRRRCPHLRGRAPSAARGWCCRPRCRRRAACRRPLATTPRSSV